MSSPDEILIARLGCEGFIKGNKKVCNKTDVDRRVPVTADAGAGRCHKWRSLLFTLPIVSNALPAATINDAVY